MAATALALILAGCIVLQALRPERRLLIVLSGAGLACLVSSLTGAVTTTRLLAAVPWDVLVLLVALGLLTEVLAASRVFSIVAVRATRLTGARPGVFAALFSVGMFFVSGLVNNLTALLLVVPVMLIVFRQMGVTQRYLSWCLGVVLVACNLGGAATPIGDFPAVLLLGSGAMQFGEYLRLAFPLALAALVGVLVAAGALARPAQDVETNRLAARLTVASVSAMHRGLAVEWKYFAPGAAALGAMLAAWFLIPSSTGVGPELIGWLGALAALLASGLPGERLVRKRVDVEATLFLLGLFVMVGAVRETGAFAALAQWLVSLPISPLAQVAVFLVVAAVLTGIFSAGPSMAALLEVANVLARQHPPGAIYVGLAMSVCAGSSLFLTAATAGPLTQALVERAGLKGPSGEVLRFGFFQFAPVGVLGFAVILGVGMVSTLLAVRG
jgi:Na+/H+ antiporter NhaD/arsenite permease-like protein